MGPKDHTQASQLASTMFLYFFLQKVRIVKFCKLTKTTRGPCRNRPDARGDCFHLPQIFGDAITADPEVLNDENESRLQHRFAVAVQDPFFLSDPKLPNEKRKYAGNDVCVPPDEKTRFYSYRNPQEFIRAEKAVHRVKEGTSLLLVPLALSESGGEKQWNALRNVQDKLADNKSPYEKKIMNSI